MQTISKTDLQLFRQLHGQVEPLLAEFGVLRGADAAGAGNALSDMQSKAVEALLDAVSKLLGDEAPVVTADVWPAASGTNSDATVMLALHLACLRSYRRARTEFRYGRLYWRVANDEKSDVAYEPVSAGGGGPGTQDPDVTDL